MNVRRHWQCAATARIVFQGKFYPCGRTCARNDLELRFKPVKRGCAQIYFCGRFNFINKLPSFLLVERRYTIGTKPHRRQSQQVKKGYSQRQSKDLATSCPSTPPRRPNPRGHPARATTEDEDRSIVAAAVVKGRTLQWTLHTRQSVGEELAYKSHFSLRQKRRRGCGSPFPKIGDESGFKTSQHSPPDRTSVCVYGDRKAHGEASVKAVTSFICSSPLQ